MVIGISGGALPRWEIIGLGLTSLSLILMAPFGLGWIFLGFMLARRGGSYHRLMHPVEEEEHDPGTRTNRQAGA